MKVYGLIFGILFCFSMNMQAQRQRSDFVEYIDKHNRLGTQHMSQYKIPASIKLAQALLESNAGKSRLARDANNHFGIKCHSNWTGRCITQADDKPDDRFRVYNNLEESFKDHSLFLQQPRYRVLFTLDILDYTAWANGLQKCGYATDPAYANKLIKVIEDYELYRYDIGRVKQIPPAPLKRPIYTDHGLLYVLAEADDSYARIATDLGFRVSNIVKYNEVPEDFPLRQGDIVYLEKKLKKAGKPYFEHIVKIGESMHSISQQYGMQVKRLYALNKKKFDYVPTEGDVLRLR